MIIADIAAAFFAAALAGMGVGGGGLLVIYLTLAREMPQLEAQGINLIFFLCSALPATAVNLKKRGINPRKLILIAIPGAAAAIPGTFLASAVDAALLRKIFGGLMILAGAATLFRRKESQPQKHRNSR